MKIALSSTGPERKDTADMRFGRCTYLIVDPKTWECLVEGVADAEWAVAGGCVK